MYVDRVPWAFTRELLYPNIMGTPYTVGSEAHVKINRLLSCLLSIHNDSDQQTRYDVYLLHVDSELVAAVLNKLIFRSFSQWTCEL